MSESSEEIFNMQGAWSSPNTLTTMGGLRSGFVALSEHFNHYGSMIGLRGPLRTR